MYSEIVDGEVLDWHFKRATQKFIYIFYIGDIYIGQIFKMNGCKWSAVSGYKNNICPVKGFGSRYDAAEFLIKLFRIHREKIKNETIKL